MSFMESTILKFERVLKNGEISYYFEGFERVKSRGELPCEYLSGPHFAAWNGILVYSDGERIFSLVPGTEIPESIYLELMCIVDRGKERLKKIRKK